MSWRCLDVQRIERSGHGGFMACPNHTRNGTLNGKMKVSYCNHLGTVGIIKIKQNTQQNGSTNKKIIKIEIEIINK